MNLNELKENDLIHVHYTYSDLNIDTNEEADVHVRYTGYFHGIDDHNEWIIICDGNYTMTFADGSIEESPYSTYEVPLWLEPVVYCERLFIEDINPLFLL